MNKLKQFNTEHDIDVCFITETYATPAHELDIENYTTYRCDREFRKGGGTAIFVKKSLETTLLRTCNSKGYEETSITLDFPTKESLILSSVYNPPKRTITPEDIDTLIPKGTHTIIGGDFNAKHLDWGCKKTNQNGRNILPLLNTNNLRIIVPQKPTHYPSMRGLQPDILDFVLTNTSIPMYADVIDDCSSDHRPVIVKIGIAKDDEEPCSIPETAFTQEMDAETMENLSDFYGL